MTFEPADEFLIEDEETFELLAHPTRLEILELCLAPRSAAELAQAMAVPRTRLYHHIKLLEDAGVIAVADTRRSGAMTEKVYRAAANSFRPSEDFLTTAEPRAQAEAVLGSLMGSTRADFVRAVENGDIRFNAQDKDARTISIGRRLMTIRRDRLHELITAVEEVLDRHDDDIEDEDDPDAVVVGVLHIIHPSSRKPA